jgi:predicted O-methyltransferase YrrM
MKDIESLNDIMNIYLDLKSAHGRRWSNRYDYPIFYSLAKFYEVDNVIECGTNTGISGLCWALALEDMDAGKVYTWDLDEHFRAEKATSLESRIIRHIGRFDEEVTKVLDTTDLRRKLFFIDGSHLHVDVRRDWTTIVPYLETGDTVVFHDYKRKGVRRALDWLTNTQRFSHLVGRNYPLHTGINAMKVVEII